MGWAGDGSAGARMGGAAEPVCDVGLLLAAALDLRLPLAAQPAHPSCVHCTTLSSPLCSGIDMRPLVAAPLELSGRESHADEAPVLYQAGSCECVLLMLGYGSVLLLILGYESVHCLC